MLRPDRKPAWLPEKRYIDAITFYVGKIYGFSDMMQTMQYVRDSLRAVPPWHMSSIAYEREVF